MRYVLDTNIVSALMRQEPAPGRRLLSVAPADVLVPQPVVAEVRYGLARLPRSHRRAALEHDARELLTAVARAPWTDDVSLHFGALKVELERRGERLDDFDVAIAAHALAHQAVLATRNVRHLGRIRHLLVEDWTRA
jgi:predicted nucleic acid-binding protein